MYWPTVLHNFFNYVNCAINFFNCALIAVLTHILFVTFFNLFVYQLQVDNRHCRPIAVESQSTPSTDD